MIDGFRRELIESTGFKLGVNYGWNKVRFPAPVPAGVAGPGQRRGRRASTTSATAGTRSSHAGRVEVEGCEKPCCVAESVVGLLASSERLPRYPRSGDRDAPRRLREQRRALPDVAWRLPVPGRRAARSSTSARRSRSASASARPLLEARRAARRHDRARSPSIEFIATETEAEALLAEQQLHQAHRPRLQRPAARRQVVPVHRRSRSTRTSRASTSRASATGAGRAYFGPFSNAKRVRETLDLLGKVFQYRTCDGPEPGRASGSPCLDYYIKRCQAPCVGYISKEDYRANIDTIIDFLSGRYRQIERDARAGHDARRPTEQEFEQAATYRNRLQGGAHACSSASGSRTRRSARSTRSRVAAEGTDANAQVFQVRDGVLADRQSFYLENAARRDEGEVAEEFVLQYYASALGDPAAGDRAAQRCADTETLAEALAERARRRRSRSAHAERGDKRRILELAERNARLALDQDRLRSERRRSQRIEALDGAPARARHGRDPDADRVLRHLEPDARPHGRLDGGVRGRRAEEVRLPPLRHPGGRAGRLRRDGRGALTADGAVRRAARALAARQGVRRRASPRCRR